LIRSFRAGLAKIGKQFTVATVIVLGLALVPLMPAAAAPSQPSGLWQKVSGKPATTKGGHKADVHAKRFAAYTLDRTAMKALLGKAPKENKQRRTVDTPTG
jgi:hypothetical protein